MWKTTEGSTGRLLQLCSAYFFFYVLTGLTVKWFLGPGGMKGMEFLPYSNLGAVPLVMVVCIGLGWYHGTSNRRVSIGSLRVPVEYLYIIPSGICTAVIIPTTTLMYTLPISVMVAMVIMRGSVIVISRAVDFIQIQQGILTKKVYWTENVAVLFAVLAVAMKTLFSTGEGAFDFLDSPVAMTILGSYVVAYTFRIYIMNYYKNTRGKGVKQDNKWFFTIEQITAASTLLLATIFVFLSPRLMEWDIPQINLFNGAITNPLPLWGWAVLAGTTFGLVSFFSVFIFMFKGRTATFAGLVNRLTSLIAGTVATLIFAVAFGGRYPSRQDWLSLACIIVAIMFMTAAEKRRARELVASREIET
jgi:hypothetical protein